MKPDKDQVTGFARTLSYVVTGKFDHKTTYTKIEAFAILERYKKMYSEIDKWHKAIKKLLDD